ncbi:MAG: Beta-(1-2)glucan export ATP-binding/permease [Candidatus Tokpelaia sp. JSC188]|nr:MAG: Beta-(1-2)glucan export ATP-binding/permease [Candidatus Tokpelaia sp. JSC188]
MKLLLFKIHQRALSYLWAEKHAFMSICIANVMLAIITIAEPILFGNVIDSIAEKTEVFMTLSMWIGFGIFNIIAYVLVARGADRLTHRRRLAVMSQSFEKIINMPLHWHQQRGTSNVVHILVRATDALTTIWLEFMRQHLSTFVALVMLIPTAIALDWRLSMVLIVLGISYIMIARLVMQKTTQGQTVLEHHHHTLFNHIADSINNIAIVQSYNLINKEVHSLRKQATNLLKVQYPVLNWWALASGLNRMAATISMVMALLLGAFLVTHGQLRVGDVVAFVGFAQLIIGRLDQISAFINLTVASHAKLEEFFEMNDSTRINVKLEKLPDLRNVKGHVRFEKVTYKFEKTNQGVFDISFDIEPGQTVAIVGRTGAGKTTLINLLQRIYDPDTGHISIDNIDTRTVSRESLRESLATVLQDINLFNRSIAANIRVGRSNASQAQMHEAAKIAAAHDFIMDKSGGYDTIVGDRGSHLSGGERQRLAIARAILKNAPILILDEATSALDVETEAHVKKALDMVSQNRTTFVIAHRLSTVRNANIVLFMNHGKLVEKGSFYELATKGGHFSSLLRDSGLTFDESTPNQNANSIMPSLSKKVK